MTKKLILLVILVLAAVPALAEMIVDTAWVRRYNGPGNPFDWARAITVDVSGNVYVTGLTAGVSTGYDYATIKYYPNADTAWVRRYNGPQNKDDVGLDIAVDGLGNIYVTGYCDGSSLGPGDYATIKYYPNGDTAWVRRYNGPGDSSDYGCALALDKSGNVYVTGYSNSGTDDDYATVKYYSNGDTAWVRRYNGPGDSGDEAYAITVDVSGNVYVTGWSNGGGSYHDYSTIKYYPSGDTAWVRRYNGPGDSTDFARDIAVDTYGNVYVTGNSWGSGTLPDYATVKYDSSGTQIWVKRYNGSANNWDIATSIAVDVSGNVCVSGHSYGSGTSYDYATVKYYPNGDTAWVRRYNGLGNSGEWSNDLAVDDSGNIYVTGASVGIGTSDDYATIKYYPNGDTDWVRRYNGPGNDEDEATAIAIDGMSNVYVTGGSYGSSTDYDYATIKYFQALRGDVNRDWLIDVGDVVFLINYLFKYGASPDPLETGDTNCIGGVDVGDVIVLINYLFKGGPEPSC